MRADSSRPQLILALPGCYRDLEACCLRRSMQASDFRRFRCWGSGVGVCLACIAAISVSAECGAEEVPDPVGEREACGATDHDAQHSAVHVAAADAGTERSRKA